ncbi:hypothetical protein NA57DRAFT_45489, partial [Rhizodiscina lignyota]
MEHILPVLDEAPSNKHDRADLFALTPLTTTLMDRLLLSLDFPSINTRQQRIAHPHTKTFKWIFSRRSGYKTWSNFASWLQSGSGLYWITGKAGSGKSTLMKFIVHHPRTKTLLASWAGGSPPIVASFYFWHAGNMMQTSQEGLLQTLLYQAISQYRILAPEKRPGRWASFSLSRDFNEAWKWPELEKAFRFLLEEQAPFLKFCFLIDGLDEFKGELQTLLSLVKRISQYPNVKICVSSRPWMIFEDTFQAKPQLMLQDLTLPDIRIYVNDNLTQTPGFMELRCMDEQYAASLVENIATKASGVFLWVVLVVKSLLEGLRDGDHLSDLQRRLDELPEELDDLFRRILHNFDTRYFRDASVLFQLVKASVSPPTLLALSFAEQTNEDLAIEAEMKPLTSNEKFYRSLTMRRRLDSRCRGLLETEVHDDWTEDDDILAKSKVDFLHRTVSEFLERADIWEKFLAATDNSFKPFAALAQSWLLQLKRVYTDPFFDSAKFLWGAVYGVLEYAGKS